MNTATANLIHFSETDLSDFSKEAHGFRCRTYKEWWTEAELKAEYDYLGRVCDENAKAEEIQEAKALEDFNKLIAETIALGAGDMKTAIKWLVDAEGLDFHSEDLKYFFWGYGLSYELQNEWAKALTT